MPHSSWYKPFRSALALSVLVGALAATITSASAQEPLAVVQPVGMSLVLAKPTTLTRDAQFKGTVVVHGFLVARWLPGGGEGGRLKAQFYLQPTPESAKSLPHFQGHPLIHVTVSQGLKLLAQATSPAIARQFASRRQLSVHAEGLFSLRGLRLNAACLSRASAQVDQVDPIGFSFQDTAAAASSCRGGG
jgi:hypothetical protein